MQGPEPAGGIVHDRHVGEAHDGEHRGVTSDALTVDASPELAALAAVAT